jgi:hypothetical protein
MGEGSGEGDSMGEGDGVGVTKGTWLGGTCAEGRAHALRTHIDNIRAATLVALT